ncbi:MAG: SBBP repeat-containing protein [Chloroflexota bacterium]
MFRSRFFAISALVMLLPSAGLGRAHAAGITFRDGIGFDTPMAVGVDARGDIFVEDVGNSRIVKLSSAGHLLSTWSTTELNLGRQSMAVSTWGAVYVADSVSSTIYRYSPSGHLETSWGLGDDVLEADALAVGGSGNVFVADGSDAVIGKYTPDGAILDLWHIRSPQGFPVEPVAIAVARSGNVYVEGITQPPNCSEYCYSSVGQTRILEKLSFTGDLLQFWPIAADALTVGGRENVVALEGATIYKYNSSGDLLNAWGTTGSVLGRYHNPASVAVGGKGNIFVADTDNNRVVKLTPNGRILAVYR